jgi:uncharacterized Zn finger protein
MSLPPTVMNHARCPLCGYRGATVLIEQWTRLFLRCQRCEHLWSERSQIRTSRGTPFGIPESETPIDCSRIRESHRRSLRPETA